MNRTLATSRNRLLVLIVLVAILARVAAALLHPFWFPDSADYDSLAKSLIGGHGYVVNGLYATRIPGYPLFVAGVYGIFGPSIKAVLLLQALMGGASTWLVYLIGRRISESIGLLAAVLAAVDPLSIGFSAALLSEAPFTLLMLAGVWALLRRQEGGGFVWWVAAGLLWGASVYMRASALWCIVPLGVWIVFRGAREQRVRNVVGAVLAVIIVFLTLLPWQIRSFGIFHQHFFRLTTLEGISLYEAVYPQADGSPKQDILPLPPEMRGMDEAERNDEWARRAWSDISADPMRIARLAVRKAGRTWSPFLNAAEFQSGLVQLVMGCWHIPLFVLAIVGLFAGWFRGKSRWRTIIVLLLLPICYFTAVHSLFLGSVRYRVPLMPLVCILAAMGISALVWRGRIGKRPDVSQV